MANDKTSTRRKIDLMQKYVDGQDIELCEKAYAGRWRDAPFEPTWNWDHYDYRIKEDRFPSKINKDLMGAWSFDEEGVEDMFNRVVDYLELLQKQINKIQEQVDGKLTNNSD